MRARRRWVTLILAVGLAAAALLSLSLGAADLAPRRAALGVLSRVPGLSALDPGLTPPEVTILFELRLPRLVLALWWARRWRSRAW